ncbi:MAG: hypothetical protein ACFFD2_10700 [Promethearchaeota archaeon]
MKSFDLRFYMLFLFKFKNDKVVFTKDELQIINESIKRSLENDKFISNPPQIQDGYQIYDLDIENVFKKYTQVISLPEEINIKEIKLGYYHHRVIVTSTISSYLSAVIMRWIRRAITKMIRELITTYIVNSINEKVKEGKINEESEIIFPYSYPVIVIKNGHKLIKEKKFPFSVETETLFFEIIESKWIKIRKKSYGFRISIPGIIIYSEGYPSKRMLRDLINAVYQHCLYIKKIDDIEKHVLENDMDESILIRLWSHMEETMGGRSIDVHIVELTHITIVFAFIAIIISIISLFVAFII